jgi:hypothetical protein
MAVVNGRLRKRLTAEALLDVTCVTYTTTLVELLLSAIDRSALNIRTNFMHFVIDLLSVFAYKVHTTAYLRISLSIY